MTTVYGGDPGWLGEWMRANGLSVWGVADLSGFETPPDADGDRYPRAVAWAVPLAPGVVSEVRNGPTEAYAAAYVRVNARIDALGIRLASEIQSRGFRAQPLTASQRTDPVNVKGDFPHKTAATRAGLGWIGRHCQLITRPFGSWVRLGTVFTDLDLPAGTPIQRQFCGRCTRCVDACPAGALTGTPWSPGILREALLDVQSCDRWKKAHYFQYNQGHVCGICSAVCPYGLKRTASAQTPQ